MRALLTAAAQAEAKARCLTLRRLQRQRLLLLLLLLLLRRADAAQGKLKPYAHARQRVGESLPFPFNPELVGSFRRFVVFQL